VRDFAEAAFSHLDLNYEDYVVVDERLYRPAEVNILMGDSTKAEEKLGWKPKIRFEELVRMMVNADLKWSSSPKAPRQSLYSLTGLR
jgi:GDPmannose 4,6-dehydratase